MSRKKKRPSAMFDLDRVEAMVKSDQDYLCHAREHMRALKVVDLERIMSNTCNLTEEEAGFLVTSKIGVQGTLVMREALTHVPENIPRVVGGISLRNDLISKVYNAMASQSNIPELSTEEAQRYSSFMERYCPLFLTGKVSTESLWNHSGDEDLFFNKFLSPPVSNCLCCGRQLTMHNDPSKANLFALEGPIPCSKISLECRTCSIRYGVANFKDETGTHFYPDQYVIDFVEVSNVTYIDLKLYRWIPSLR